jgi:hypothetical protein
MRLKLLSERVQDLEVRNETYVATAPSRLVIGSAPEFAQYINKH